MRQNIRTEPTRSSAHVRYQPDDRPCRVRFGFRARLSLCPLHLLYRLHEGYIVSMKAEMAATMSFIWHMLSATLVVQYAENSAYILFLCIGGTLGTYLTV